MPSRDTSVEICGTEFDVVVEFDITSYGSADSWEEPGDPPEIEVTAVYYLDDKGDPEDRDISGLLSELKDQELRLHWGQLAYGFGFKIYHGGTFGDPLRPETRWRSPPSITFNEGRSILESLEAEIYENFHDYESCDEPEDWHD